MEPDVGAFLQRCREERGLTQNAVAKGLGVVRSAVAQWEAGGSFALRRLPAVLAAYGLDLEQRAELAEMLGLITRPRKNRHQTPVAA